jgi:hypothetical protein
MPGLCLTRAQASRLFDLPVDVCTRIFDELMEDGALVLTVSGRYRLRPDTGSESTSQLGTATGLPGTQ